MKIGATQAENIVMGMVFFIISLSLPLVGILPNHAVAADAASEVVAAAEAQTDEAREATADKKDKDTIFSLTISDEEDQVSAQALESEIKAAISGSFEGDDVGSEILIPILALLLIFGLPPAVLIVLIVLYFRARRRAQENRAELVARLLEKGQEVPKELLLGDMDQSLDSRSSRHKGVRNIGLGTGIAICFGALFSWQAGTLGLILIGLGVAQLVSARMARAEHAAP